MHAVHRLYRYRKQLSTSEFKARGKKVVRCEFCCVSKKYCICDLKPSLTVQQQCNAGFALIMYNAEVLKPSNTGRLIADIIPNTYAFLWSRTSVDPKLLALLADEKWQPIIVFPKQYSRETQTVFTQKAVISANKKPLYIMLDGTWREARKMFNKSPYLAQFPILSITPKQLLNQGEDVQIMECQSTTDINSSYQLRKAKVNNQLATAEVAAEVLKLNNENLCGQLLSKWFDVFSFQYQQSVCQKNSGNKQAIEQLNQFIQSLG